MRSGRVLAVSSALLFLCAALVPHHVPSSSLPAVVSDFGEAHVIISEFYPCALQDDEYLVLENIGGEETGLCGWTVTDHEGVLEFTSNVTLAPGKRMAISSNSSSYVQAFGSLPDVRLDCEDCPVQRSSGTFRLADTGDSLTLVSADGTVVDFVVYGLCSEVGIGWSGSLIPALKKGEVAKRVGSSGLPGDTDCADDWTCFREHRYGFTQFRACSSYVGANSLTAFVSPDCGLTAVTTAIGEAARTIRLCAYELSSRAVCSALLHALWRGASVSVLVDGAPAGGMSDDEIGLLSFLKDSGADVRVLSGNVSERIVQHVGPLHSKYLVVDDRLAVVLSENFVESGLPEDPFDGNRGWGVVLRDERIALYLAGLFDEDSRSTRPDVRRWGDDSRYVQGWTLDDSIDIAVTCGIISPHTTTLGCSVTVVPSPDCSPAEPFVVPLLEGADRLLVEQFQADLMWRDRWTGTDDLNPLVAAVENALANGANTSVLLDQTWFNLDDNSEVADHINAYVRANGLLGEGRLMDASGPAKVLHNKGIVIDRDQTVVSSNNWGVSSFSRNRELAVIVESAEVAAYFEAAFWMDWDPDTEPPEAEIGASIQLAVGESVLVDGSGSRDDRGIAEWTWTLDGDGLLTPDGASARFYAARPGTYVVRLCVRDAWGNMDSAAVRIEVAPLDGADDMADQRIIVAGTASALAGAAAGALLARKLNHHNRGSR